MATTELDLAALDEILERNERQPELLIQVLQDMQSRFGYLPEEGLRRVAVELGVPLPRVYHVATFYKAFSLRPRGKHVITVCRGTACHVRGSERLVETAERELGIRDGETTEDLLFTLECVNCLGVCALAPVVVVDGVYYEKVTPDRLRAIIGAYASGREAEVEAAAAGTHGEAEPPEEAREEPAEQARRGAAAEAPGPSKTEVRRRTRKQKRKAKKAKGRRKSTKPSSKGKKKTR